VLATRTRRQTSGGVRFPARRRVLLWLFRTLVVLALLALLLLGVRDIVREVLNPTPRSAGGPTGTTAQTSFPTEAASAYASRFAMAYETYDDANPQGHMDSLSPYVSDGVDPMLGWDGQGTQKALQAVPAGITVQGKQRATVTVAVLVDGGRWVYLAVPVLTSGGQFVIPGQPALVAPPSKATVPTPSNDPGDPNLARQLMQPMSAFFKAYAASSPSDLTYYAVPGASFEGLKGTVQFDSLTDLHVFAGGGNARQATARVKWYDPKSGARTTQSYKIGLQLVNGQWHVSSVTPAGL
jgi:hypothetical protein